ncbi:MAG: M56 family metallopeptidase [Bryobacteraceae bacterium]
MIPLANHLLQSTLFAAVIGLLALAFRRDRARTRHSLWMAASVKFLIPFSLLVSLSSRFTPGNAPAVPPPQLRFVIAELRQSVAPTLPSTSPATAPARPDWLPNAAWALCLFGSAAILIRWRRRWKRVAAAVHGATPVPDVVAQALAHALTRAASPMLGTEARSHDCERCTQKCVRHGEKRIAVLASPSTLEPGVFGIFRPVLLLPAGIEERLSGAQLQAVLAHELCHIRRRDNLAAAVHMLVESLFWFHPLVWWLGARLVDERELACDEEVLQLGADPEIYAESLLKVCEFCFESPLACVSGIAGADLQRRIQSIMTPRLAPQLEPGKKLLLALLTIAAVAGPIAVGVLHPTRIQARSQPQTAAPLSFDVASVKPVDQPWLQVFPQRTGGRVTWTTDLHYLVGYAYHLQDWRISGPLPGSDCIYAVDATMAPAATEDQVRLMFQSLLADRFKMAAHRVTKEVEGYALTVGKNGPKFKEAKAEEKPAALPEWFQKQGDIAAQLEGKVVATIPKAGVGAITGRRASMLQLTEALQRVLRLPVLDQTGLSGNYYFALEFAQEDHPADVDAPPLFTAIQESLGLKLERHKGPVEMLVVDHIEKTPTEN